MASGAAFERLVRFKADQGKILYGNLSTAVGTDAIIGSSVEILDGDVQTGFSKTGRQAKVRKLLSPVPVDKVVYCIGLNYMAHAKEFKLDIPDYPVVFSKPPDSIVGPFDDVHIHKDAQSKLDYEGELTVIIGKDAKNVKSGNALDYVLGFTVGNDVSARNFQVPASVSGGQVSYAKSFDYFAPIGPAITAPEILGDCQQLEYTTKVNGEVRQKTNTSDMIWTVRQIIEHLSRGRTLRAGTVIMTGTPSGVALFMDPPGFLKDGDVVEIEVEKIGKIRNKMVFE